MNLLILGMVENCEVVVVSEGVGVSVVVTGVERTVTVVSGLTSEAIILFILVTAARMCVMLSVAVIEVVAGNAATVGESGDIDDNAGGIVSDTVVTGVSISIGIDVGVVSGFIVVSIVATLVGFCVLVGASTDTIVGFSEGE